MCRFVRLNYACFHTTTRRTSAQEPVTSTTRSRCCRIHVQTIECSRYWECLGKDRVYVDVETPVLCRTHRGYGPAAKVFMEQCLKYDAEHERALEMYEPIFDAQLRMNFLELRWWNISEMFELVGLLMVLLTLRSLFMPGLVRLPNAWGLGGTKR